MKNTVYYMPLLFDKCLPTEPNCKCLEHLLEQESIFLVVANLKQKQNYVKKNKKLYLILQVA